MSPGHVGKQHVEMWRKLAMRRRILPLVGPGDAYVPFCGRGDIAVELYRDRLIYAADINASHVAAMRERVACRALVVADCGAVFPFAGVGAGPWSVADFDAWANPYVALRAFWTSEAGAVARRGLAVFGTDGRIRGFKAGRTADWPGQEPMRTLGPGETGLPLRAYWTRFVRPWLAALFHPRRIVSETKYRRGNMLYWGVLVR